MVVGDFDFVGMAYIICDNELPSNPEVPATSECSLSAPPTSPSRCGVRRDGGVTATEGWGVSERLSGIGMVGRRP